MRLRQVSPITRPQGFRPVNRLTFTRITVTARPRGQVPAQQRIDQFQGVTYQRSICIAQPIAHQLQEVDTDLLGSAQTRITQPVLNRHNMRQHGVVAKRERRHYTQVIAVYTVETTPQRILSEVLPTGTTGRSLRYTPANPGR